MRWSRRKKKKTRTTKLPVTTARFGGPIKGISQASVPAHPCDKLAARTSNVRQDKRKRVHSLSLGRTGCACHRIHCKTEKGAGSADLRIDCAQPGVSGGPLLVA